MEFKLSFSKDEWAAFSGEQRLAIGLLRRVVADLRKPTSELIVEVTDWLSFDGPLGPSFCDQLFDLEDGVVKAHMSRKIEEAKICLVHSASE